VTQCRRCLYTSNHALGITFDETGLCSGCKIHEEKDQLDWRGRWRKLEKLVAQYRSNSAKYDCIVPSSGANDSFFILDVVVNKLGLKPLVVSYNKLFNTKVGIENLARQRIAFNVDFQQKIPDPRAIKKITRSSIFKFGNPYWHCLAGKSVYPVQTAVQMKIPLIIWGAHQGLEQVGMFSHLHEVEMTRRYRKDHDLFGVESDGFTETYDDLNEEDLMNFRYPAFSDIKAIGVRGIYLGNFVRWDPYAQHIDMVQKFGFKGLRQSRTFDAYDHADCYVYSNIHDVFKFLKHGYSKVTDQASREIRFGRLSRERALQIVRQCEYQQPDHMEKFCDWLGVSERSLKMAMEQHRNTDIWSLGDDGRWSLNQNYLPPGEASEESLVYPKTTSIEAESAVEKFITIGKGVDWPIRAQSPSSVDWIA
jgi:N-acetyl sugar amidotransferase